MANPQNLKPFKKGGDPRINMKGAPPKLPNLDRHIAEILAEEHGNIDGLKAILKALRNSAIKGNVRAAEALLNRAFGKPKEFIEHSGEMKTISETTLFKVKKINNK